MFDNLILSLLLVPLGGCNDCDKDVPSVTGSIGSTGDIGGGDTPSTTGGSIGSNGGDICAPFATGATGATGGVFVSRLWTLLFLDCLDEGDGERGDNFVDDFVDDFADGSVVTRTSFATGDTDAIDDTSATGGVFVSRLLTLLFLDRLDEGDDERGDDFGNFDDDFDGDFDDDFDGDFDDDFDGDFDDDFGDDFDDDFDGNFDDDFDDDFGFFNMVSLSS